MTDPEEAGWRLGGFKHSVGAPEDASTEADPDSIN